MTAYYNENDPFAAAWLRELIKDGLIAPGDVDERSIVDVKGCDLHGYTQCHFFGGIGGWSYALRLAGWPDDRPVWTGSCPCQPFSNAGKGLGESDERHLWPVFRELIRECQPATVFGEQVASKAGREWLSGVFADLEGMAYQRAGADLCAAGVGAPHIRQRLYWAARLSDQWKRVVFSSDCDEDGNCPECGIDYGECGCPGPTQDDIYEYIERNGILYARRLGHSEQQRLEGHAGNESNGDQPRWISPKSMRPTTKAGSPWDSYDILPCRDGQARRVEPGSFPMATRLPEHMGLIRGYGNAIVPQLAAEFIKAFCEVQEET